MGNINTNLILIMFSVINNTVNCVHTRLDEKEKRNKPTKLYRVNCKREVNKAYQRKKNPQMEQVEMMSVSGEQPLPTIAKRLLQLPAVENTPMILNLFKQIKMKK